MDLPTFPSATLSVPVIPEYSVHLNNTAPFSMLRLPDGRSLRTDLRTGPFLTVPNQELDLIARLAIVNHASDAGYSNIAIDGIPEFRAAPEGSNEAQLLESCRKAGNRPDRPPVRPVFGKAARVTKSLQELSDPMWEECKATAKEHAEDSGESFLSVGDKGFIIYAPDAAMAQEFKRSTYDHLHFTTLHTSLTNTDVTINGVRVEDFIPSNNRIYDASSMADAIKKSDSFSSLKRNEQTDCLVQAISTDYSMSTREKFKNSPQPPSEEDFSLDRPEPGSVRSKLMSVISGIGAACRGK